MGVSPGKSAPFLYLSQISFQPRERQLHPVGTCSVQITALFLPWALAGPWGQLLGGLFWGGGGEAGWACAVLHCTGGCWRVVLYPGAGELRERHVGVLATMLAVQLLQGLQAGRPTSQALLASDSAHQTETGQRVTNGSALALETAALCAGMGMVGDGGSTWWGKAPRAVPGHQDPSSAHAKTIWLHRALRACVAYTCTRVFHGGLVPRGVLTARK